jgi:uncharacterized repeat protein (TIGR01451 family)
MRNIKAIWKMKVKNTLLSALFIILVFSAIAPVLADDFSGTLTVNIDRTSLKVGDTVNIYVIASNDGLGDWTNLKIYAPIPQGLQYVSHDMPDRAVKEYDPNTGIWNVYQMRDTNRGKLKEMIITCIVLPEASGDNIVATARFYSLRWHGTNAEGRIAQAYSPVAVVSGTYIAPKNDTNMTKNDALPGYDDNGEGPGGGGGKGPGFGNETGSGINTVTITGNSLMDSAIENLTKSSNKEPLYNSQTGGGGGGGKQYELIGNTPSSTDTQGSVYIVAVLAIIGLLLVGYFYGIKKDR